MFKTGFHDSHIKFHFQRDVYAATTHNTRLEMKGAKRDDVFINEVRPYFLAHFLLTGNLKTL